jgi:hypothetical protein
MRDLADNTTVAELRESIEQQVERCPGLDPEDLWTVADELSCGAIISWRGSRAQGEFDVAFLPCRQQSSDVWPVFPPAASLRAASESQGSVPWQPRFAARLSQELREEMKSRLPEHMVPAAIVVLERFPLTPQGKLDRCSLPPPEIAGLVRGEHYAAPRSSLEAKLAQIWCEVLRVRQVGIHDNFFDLGGHSLLATQVVARVREACRVELPLRAMFESPTVAQLALAIAAASEARAP